MDAGWNSWVMTAAANSCLRWSDIESLLGHFGAVVREGRGSAISVTLNGITAYFHRPHPGDKARKWQIETAVRLLEEAGVDPDGSRQRSPAGGDD